jgi:tetratricopeptide (TPR) repeat protein
MSMLDAEAIDRARQAMRQGNHQGAVQILFQTVQQTHLQARDYDEFLRNLANALVQSGRVRAAATVWLYLQDSRQMAQLVANEPRDLARAAQLEGNHAAAAQYYRNARWPAHAAIEYEEARQFPAARVLWEEVTADPRLREDPYTAALVSFNLGRVLAQLNDPSGAHRCRVRAMRLLEEAADALEARGLRERAFDCFQVLLTLGAETGSFENLAEGYLNCIRILKEDHLKYYALQYYEDFIARAERASEHHAVATILHEASDYARGLGLKFHPTLRVREAEAWRRAAEHTLASGGSVELAENALLAAVGAYSAVGLHGRAVSVFATLASLPGSDEKRAKRYKVLAERYAQAQDEPSQAGPLPEYLRQPVAYPDIWNDDVIEWEEQGDTVETCGEILLDRSLPDFVRRKAMIARLHPLMAASPNDPQTRALIATSLGDVQLYSVLAPLEHLYDKSDGYVRVAVLQAAGKLFFKRTFGLIIRAAGDRQGQSDPNVRRATIEAINKLHFPHAFDPLSRLHRDADDPQVSQSALGSIGRIQLLEAVEYLIGVLLHGTQDEKRQAAELLARHDMPETSLALQNAMAHESVEVAREIQNILRRRGGR